ncbi:FAD/NAD(P)-binding domain-containing protein [Marasmius fiardii PR-910]|nr:FAD/NAD(P)-binding domain-containing protein [Marasmius fiardii PR-910]
MSNLPPHHPHPPSTNPTQIAEEWIKAFSSALSSGSTTDLFIEGSYWRDIVALTSDIRTFKGVANQIKPFLEARSRLIVADSLKLIHDHDLKKPGIAEVFPDLAFLQFGFTFKVSYGGSGTGIVRLVYTGEEKEGVKGWKVFTIFTCLDQLDSSVEKVAANRPTEPIVEPWDEVRRKQVEFEDKDPDVLIIGAGQTGLEVAARLKQLDVDALVIDKNPRIGDNWRNRYDSLALHDTIWYDNPPYLSFPSSWPVYCSAGKLANFLESYAETLELAVWTGTEVVGNAEWDEKGKTWTVQLNRGGKKRTVKVKHIVFGTGFGGGVPNLPKIPGAENFKGKIYHSSEFKSARNHKGEKALVVGACNSGHDIAQDFVRQGIDVTMYQRSSTYVISAAAIAMLLGGTFNENTINHLDWADRSNASIPYPVIKVIQQRVVPALMGSVDKDIVTRLEKVGFKCNSGPDGAGVFPLLFEKAGGYYIGSRPFFLLLFFVSLTPLGPPTQLDTGGSEDIVTGKIKLISGAGGGIKRFNDSGDGVVFEDGSELKGLGVVVFATGFADAAESLSPVLGPTHTSKLHKIWGLDEEGELNSVWRESGVEGVWVGIGNLAMCRYFSGVLALEIKGRLVGVLPGKY